MNRCLQPIGDKLSSRRSRSTKNQQATDEPLSAAVHHILEIKDWDWAFSFGANEFGDIDGPYWDYRHLELRCTMLGPLTTKVAQASLHLLPMHDLDDTDARRAHNSNYDGILELRKKRLTGSLYLPFDVLATALQMMISDRWHFVVLGGDAFLSGRSSIKSYRLQRSLDDDDLSLIDR
jgi:hypothetical protein